jgi:hypothetical protein
MLTDDESFNNVNNISKRGVNGSSTTSSSTASALEIVPSNNKTPATIPTTSNNSMSTKFGITFDDEMLEITTDARRDISDLIDRSQGSKNLMDVPVIEDSSIRTHYDDFHTIDWLKDLARDRFRHRIIQKKRTENFLQRLITLHDAWSGWICVLLVGLSSGLAAGMVDIGTSWMTNLKDGICINAFWLNKAQCCWASRQIKYDKHNNPECPEWWTWPQVITA